MEEIKNRTLLLPKSDDEKTIIDFIDKNIVSSFVSKLQQLKLVSVLKDGVRDPRKYVEADKIAQFKASIEEFTTDAMKSGDFDKFRKLAVGAKTFNTLANVAISSFLLAGVLPKIQFWFREKLTKSKLDPGVKKYAQN